MAGIAPVSQKHVVRNRLTVLDPCRNVSTPSVAVTTEFMAYYSQFPIKSRGEAMSWQSLNRRNISRA